jgi:adenylate kinase
MKFVILGAPGSGKGTQAARIAEKHSLRHISTGDLLREAVANRTKLGRQVESILASGQLVSDDIVLGLIRETLGGGSAGRGWILDGFPRNTAQADALEGVLKEIGQAIEFILVLDVDAELIVERLSNRRTCSSCKTVYNMLNKPPKAEGICDKCGGKLIHRDDDMPETIRDRLQVYDRQTRPIIDFYEGRYPIHRVDGTMPIDEVTVEIERLVG